MERRTGVGFCRRELAATPKGSHYITPMLDGAEVIQLRKQVPKAITAMSP